MMMYLILALAQKSLQQPGSRRRQEVKLVNWIDRSTNNKLERGGAGIFIEDKKRAIEERLSFVAGEICSSFGTEGVAMLRALQWMELQLSSVLTAYQYMQRVQLERLPRLDQKDKDSEQESQGFCHNVMGNVALRGRGH